MENKKVYVIADEDDYLFVNEINLSDVPEGTEYWEDYRDANQALIDKRADHILENGDGVFCDCFLNRNANAPGGWSVSGFEGKMFYDGQEVESLETKNGWVYFTTK